MTSKYDRLRRYLNASVEPPAGRRVIRLHYRGGGGLLPESASGGLVAASGVGLPWSDSPPASLARGRRVSGWPRPVLRAARAIGSEVAPSLRRASAPLTTARPTRSSPSVAG